LCNDIASAEENVFLMRVKALQEGRHYKICLTRQPPTLCRKHCLRLLRDTSGAPTTAPLVQVWSTDLALIDIEEESATHHK